MGGKEVGELGILRLGIELRAAYVILRNSCRSTLVMAVRARAGLLEAESQKTKFIATRWKGSSSDQRLVEKGDGGGLPEDGARLPLLTTVAEWSSVVQ